MALTRQPQISFLPLLKRSLSGGRWHETTDVATIISTCGRSYFGLISVVSVLVSWEWFFFRKRDFWRSKVLVFKARGNQECPLSNLSNVIITIKRRAGFFPPCHERLGRLLVALPCWGRRAVWSEHDSEAGPGLGRCGASPSARFCRFTSVLTWQQCSYVSVLVLPRYEGINDAGLFGCLWIGTRFPIVIYSLIMKFEQSTLYKLWS